ncbi:RsiW-degrading membrane proteinase PrsW (M82 family) [Chitinophaga skermanii]|uniref:Protease PrsW n=1 Tax=Chitinophaga skermanii TaxID=331697 RepID=A0A327QTC3_9BACT|nr:PrsW family glutamic-type intramembrane protease [Chitinophaga skermanii]RAJ05007.1 RsiW-degrading membrane proteinase PrsW (M82 family) [Chitinophaga skermanii]
MILLLALAIAPGLLISVLIYALDRYDKEPLPLLTRSFTLGVMCTLLPLAIQYSAQKLGVKPDSSNAWHIAAFSFLLIGISEEVTKFLVLRFYAYPKAAFNEPYDGIVYSVLISMGFATAENIVYVSQYGVGTAIARMFLAVPAHAAFAIMMGYFVGLAKFSPRPDRPLLFLQAIAYPVIFHGAYDFFLLLDSGAYLMFGSIAALYIATKFSIKAIKRHREISEYIHEHEHKSDHHDQQNDDFIY